MTTFNGTSKSETLTGGILTSDTVSYAHSSEGVDVTLAGRALIDGMILPAGHGSGGDAQGDVLVWIDNLVGSKFSDRLAGNSLDNILTGGKGADTFVFSGKIGHDTITDFSANGHHHDTIELDGWFRDFDDLRSHAHADGHDVVIALDAYNSITLEDVSLHDLHASDFYLV